MPTKDMEHEESNAKIANKIECILIDRKEIKQQMH